MSSIISQSLNQMNFGQPVYYLSMAMFPLVGNESLDIGHEIPYLTLAEALKKDMISIE